MTTRQIRPDWQAHYGTEYVAIGPFCWGRGETRAAAFAAARKEYGRDWRKAQFVIYLVPKGAEVTEMGGFRFPADAECIEVDRVPKPAKPRLKKRLEARAVPAAEIPGLTERRQRLLEAEKRCQKLTASVNYAEPYTHQVFTVDLHTWNEFAGCCREAKRRPEDVLREAVVRDTRANIMAKAEKG